MAGIGGIGTQSALTALDSTTGALANLYGQLSSGQRIQNAGDDPSGLAIYEQLTAQANGFGQGSSNAGEAQDATNVASGALGSISDVLQRLNSLAVQGSSDLLNPSERQDLQVQASQLVQQIGTEAQSASFNGQPLLSALGLTVQTGASEGATSTISAGAVSASTLGVGSLDFSTTASSQQAEASIQAAIGRLGSQQATLGAQTVAVGYDQQNAQTSQNNLIASGSAIEDANLAADSTEIADYNAQAAVEVDLINSANTLASQTVGILFDRNA